MSAQANSAPVIIKRKKVVKGGGHHGGAWKVAYADFVTAMMAFFMLMWLLNATTEQQRKGLADYFSPTIPIVRVSGGGNGSFGGDSIFSEMTLPKNGTGASANRPASENKARGASGNDPSAEDSGEQDQAFVSLDAMLQGFGGESFVMENALEHIVTRITDEGLVIEVFSRNHAEIFQQGTDAPTQLLKDITVMIAQISKTVTNEIAVEGHVHAQPLVLKENSVWDLSQRRATQVRLMMEQHNIAPKRIARITGHADREPVVRNPMAIRNDRIEIILLRDTP
ncbi:OmpA/MotB family protein [Sulfitobacter donghicola]|uniref:Chemotaxis protein MotB n=1 Tax=Sulfitobacter donghicola DSW-25 = KCTC 12864 = JCM 14565 TaxID=1300350 RepID=A0A073IJS7_9RHOB|nr:flagellar motor protein MotB [Sulfitobacter donghicola]KEJ90533.1 chemotaxis protein MotB [Sulfitobacter donghicola DSW-25 = KCTC 12864 = JCM 14565]KIN67775.1 MotB-like protein [Sulfitobacter donghicola DSW-25 = KCTC 12864 = JCM 14565]